MTLHLVLTRHAKSAWDDPALDDHERPLNKRGRKAATRIGRWIAQRARPDLALVSTARRAVETWQGLAGWLHPTPEVRLLPGLYHADAAEMAEVLREAQGDTVLMIGHNPALAEFAADLVSTPPDHPDFARYPSAATLIVAFDIESWAAFRPGEGRAVDFAIPRELSD